MCVCVCVFGAICFIFSIIKKGNWTQTIKVVTSMGKQTTGKSYMLVFDFFLNLWFYKNICFVVLFLRLNHLFGSKFDISGGCIDGVWLNVKIIDNTMYIVMNLKGLGSMQRTSQEVTPNLSAYL